MSPRALPRGTWPLPLRLAAGTPTAALLQSCSGRTYLRRTPGSPFMHQRCPVGVLHEEGLPAAHCILSQPSKILHAGWISWPVLSPCVLTGAAVSWQLTMGQLESLCSPLCLIARNVKELMPYRCIQASLYFLSLPKFPTNSVFVPFTGLLRVFGDNGSLLTSVFHVFS